MLAAVSRELVDDGLAPPFELRPGLVAEMLALYDHIRRLGRTVDDFERNFRDELEQDRDTDRGAAQLLQQTRFLAAAYRAYETRAAAANALRRARAPRRAGSGRRARPLRRVVITVADRIADPDGLWPADFDLLTGFPDSSRSISCAPRRCSLPVYSSGSTPRFRRSRRSAAVLAATVAAGPGHAAPRDPHAVFSYRDREEELAAWRAG